MTGGRPERNAPADGVATIPLLSIAAVFYNTRLALYLYFLLLVVHFLPGRVDTRSPSKPAEGR